MIERVASKRKAIIALTRRRNKHHSRTAKSRCVNRIRTVRKKMYVIRRRNNIYFSPMFLGRETLVVCSVAFENRKYLGKNTFIAALTQTTVSCGLKGERKKREGGKKNNETLTHIIESRVADARFLVARAGTNARETRRIFVGSD